VVREVKPAIDPELLQRLYNKCDGWIERVDEKLAEEEDIQIPYSTLPRLHGTGANVVIVPEMEAFARQLSFRFVCHEKGHPNRNQSVSSCASEVQSKTTTTVLV
jgi:hypothetical protein